MPDLNGSMILQLPLNPSAPLEATGNVPMAGASLAAAASLNTDTVIDQNTVDTEGDRSLIDIIADRSPRLAAFTLYMWNAERSTWLAKMLKRKMPGLITVAGGPEVSDDNEWLISSNVFNLLISGEGEQLAAEILNPASVENLISKNGTFLETGRMSFSPGTYPNPWLTGYLDPAGGASVHVETIRGCSGGCTYCSYRKSHPFPRILDAKSSAKLLENLIEAGAKEIVFLDPTFNDRGDLTELLKRMSNLDSQFFGEMRGDLISDVTATLIADAGFRNVEIGLQSINRNTLIRSGRPGNPLKVLDGALRLKKAGVTPIIDIILGLPGDNPEDSIKTALMIKDRDLHQQVQVFYLSILPGTSMRQEFRNRYMPLPPYYRFSDKSMGGFGEAREEIADIFGYDLDLGSRPLLFEGWPGTELVDLDTDPDLQRWMPSFRHGAIRIISENLWSDRKLLLEFVRTRMEADPFCVLDVVLCPRREFPLNLIDLVRALDDPADYSGRTHRILGRQGNLRVSILIDEADGFSADWLAAAASDCTVVLDADSPFELNMDLWGAGVCVRLPGSDWDMSKLSSEVPSMHQVLFSDRQMEAGWSKSLDI